MELVCGQTLRRIEAHLASVLDRLFPLAAGVAGGTADVVDGSADMADGAGRGMGLTGLEGLNCSIRGFVLSGGKRLRPQLCVWTYERVQGFGFGVREGKGPGADVPSSPDPQGVPATVSSRLAASLTLRPSALNAEPRTSISPQNDLPAPLLDIAAAWELLHAFLLAHDDIIDESDVRRGRPSLHRHLASLDGDSPAFGTSLAIVAGDLMFGAATRLLHEMDVTDLGAGGCGAYRQVLRLFSRVVCTTGFGQAADICQSHAPLDGVCEDALLGGYHGKTAAYTFEGPMLSGALLGGLGEAARPALSRFALSLGVAYQLHNDLLDLHTAAHDGCDLVQGKRTVTLLRGRSAMPARQRRRFDRRFDSLRTANGRAVAIAESLRQELLGAGADGRTRELIEQSLSAARAAAADVALPPPLAEGMGQLLDALEARYFARV